MSQIEYLADQLDRAFHGGAWHGKAVAEVLRGVDETMAAARPAAASHTIWEIVRHLTLWLEEPRRRLNGEPTASIPAEVDWSPPTAPTSAAWQQDVHALHQAHDALRSRVLDLKDSQLDDPVAGSDPTVRGMLFGILQHYSYHAGQIVLLRQAIGGNP
jgi:uncharacterized damage-inducible protein DinB